MAMKAPAGIAADSPALPCRAKSAAPFPKNTLLLCDVKPVADGGEVSGAGPDEIKRRDSHRWVTKSAIRFI